jgi:NitT/TauT family transport system substrate-binding protein
MMARSKMKKVGLVPLASTFALLVVFFSARLGYPEQVKQLTKLMVGYGSVDGSIAPLWFAKETGLFEKHGLDVVLVGMGTGSVSLRALIAKEVALASVSAAGLIQAALQGADTLLISSAINGFVFKIMTIQEITSPAQLKGKRLGVSRYGATSDFAARLALKKWGMVPEKDLKILQIGTSQDAARALLAGLIDAGVLSGTGSFMAKRSGFRELADLSELGLHYPHAPIGTTKSFLQQNEKIVKAFMLAYIEAIHDYKKDRETALKVLRRYTRTEGREILEDNYDTHVSKYLPLPIPTREGIKTILAEISGTFSGSKTVDPDQFVAYKILREIEASGIIKRLYEK